MWNLLRLETKIETSFERNIRIFRWLSGFMLTSNIACCLCCRMHCHSIWPVNAVAGNWCRCTGANVICFHLNHMRLWQGLLAESSTRNEHIDSNLMWEVAGFLASTETQLFLILPLYASSMSIWSLHSYCVPSRIVPLTFTTLLQTRAISDSSTREFECKKAFEFQDLDLKLQQSIEDSLNPVPTKKFVSVDDSKRFLPRNHCNYTRLAN